MDDIQTTGTKAFHYFSCMSIIGYSIALYVYFEINDKSLCLKNDPQQSFVYAGVCKLKEYRYTYYIHL